MSSPLHDHSNARVAAAIGDSISKFGSGLYIIRYITLYCIVCLDLALHCIIHYITVLHIK